MLRPLEAGRSNHYYSDEKEAHARLSEEKAAVEYRKKVLESGIKHHSIALSPVERLSHDVLHRIFTLCCEDSRPACFPGKGWDPLPQTILSHVCSRWRRIMLSNPAFWDDVVLDLNCDAPDRAMDAARNWASRVGNVPCYADLWFWDKEGDTDDEPRDEAFYNHMAQQAVSLHKFKVLRMTFAKDYLREFMALPDENLSCIEDLRIRYFDEEAVINSQSPERLDFSKLSRLNSFSLEPLRPKDPIFYKGARRFANIPWHQLYHIWLGVVMPVRFCLRILQLSSPILKTCVMIVSEDRSFITVPLITRKPIYFNQLQAFTVDIFHPEMDVQCTIDPFLSLLRMPNLKLLRLGTPGRSNMPVGLQTIIELKEASGMQLETFAIADTRNPINVRTLLASIPSLRYVTLPRKIEFQAEAIDELAAGSIGPNIEDLTIWAHDLESERLLQMVEARCAIQKVGGLQQIEPTPFKHVSLPRNSVLPYHQRISKLRKAGVLIDLNLGPGSRWPPF